MSKNIPQISQLLRAIVVEDYEAAINIVTNKNFNPNEKNSSWGAPVITAIISVISENSKISTEKNFKEILKEIVKHKDFDPNVVDDTGETILMHIARKPSFNWLAPFIINNGKLDLSIKNQMKRNAIEIAEKCNNTILADILLGIKTSSHKGLPRKREGIKKKIISNPCEKNKEVLSSVENAFDYDHKIRPISLYNLLFNFFHGEYATCMDIIRDVNFDPNECDRWEEPVLSSLIYYSQDSRASYDENNFRTIVNAIIEHPRFNVNVLDSDGNTTLMVAMSYPKLKWIVEKLFKITHARIDVINDLGYNLREIAASCGNEDFYNQLLRKTYETASEIF